MSFSPYIPAPYVPFVPVGGLGSGTSDDGSWLSKASQSLIGIISGIPAGVTATAKAGYHDIGANIHGKSTGLLFTDKPGGQLGQKIIIPSVKSEIDYWKHLPENLREGNIAPLIVDALTLGSLGLGRVGAVALTPKELGKVAKTKAAVTGRYGGDRRQIVVRASDEPGSVQVIRELPRSGWRAGKAVAGQKIATKITGTKGIKVAPGKTFGGEFKKARKAAAREAQQGLLATTSDPRVVRWSKAWDKLSTPQRIAFNVMSRVPLAKDLEVWKGILRDSDQPASNQTLRLIENPNVQKEYAQASPKLQEALDAWKGITDARQEILLRHGAIDPLGIEQGLSRHTQLLRGAEILTKSRAYKRIRSLNAAIRANELQTKRFFNPRTRVGKPLKESSKTVQEQIDAGRKAALAEIPEADRAAYEKIVGTSKKRFEQARAIRAQWVEHFYKGIYDSKDLNRLHVLQTRMEKAYDAFENALDAEMNLQQRSAALGAKGTAEAIQARRDVMLGLRAQYHELLDARHELISNRDYVEMLRQRIPKSNVGPLVGGVSPEVLAAELAKERPGFQLGYVHDEPATLKRKYVGSNEAGSIGPPRPQADVYPSRLTLFSHGIIDLTGDPIGPAFFRAAKHQMQVNLHEWAMAKGQKVPVGKALPPGYEWVKKYRGQRIPPTLTAEGEHTEAVNVFAPLTKEEHDQITGLKLTDDEKAKTADGKYWVAVPKQVADGFRAQFNTAGGLPTRILRSVTNVWRALLLRTRLNWLENNIIGNTFMASIRFAGVDGLKSFLGLVENLAGPKKVAQLLRMDVSRNVLSDADFARFGPSALRATGIETQLPTSRFLRGGTLRPGNMGRAAGVLNVARRGLKGTINLLPRADRWYEQQLRKGGFMTTLRQQPEVRAIYNAQKGRKSWRDAMVQAMEQDPGLASLATREMNDALGDFLSMNRFEREQIRQLVPFYAWLREITKITAKMVVDTPGRALVLEKLGQIGDEQTAQDVPSYLRGGIPVGHVPSWLGGTTEPGQQTIIGTAGLNPWMTPVQIAAAIATLAHPSTAQSTRPLAGQLSPFLAPFFDLNRSEKIGGYSVPLGVIPAYSTITNLPEYRVLFPRESTLYPTRGALDRWTQQFGGNPLRTYDIAEALARRQEGQ